MGTIVAAHLAAAEPEAVRSLALFGPLLAPPEQARGEHPRARREGASEGMQPIADAFLQASTFSRNKAKRHAAVAFVRESLMAQDPDGYARSCEALAEAQAADTAKIVCPTLLVTGDEDAVAPPQSVRMMGQKIAGSRVEVLRGCGHWTPVEKPEECISFSERIRVIPTGEDTMANVLFTNVRIIDATGAQPYAGEVLVQGNRISRVGRGARSLPAAGVTVIDGAGATLMPGMCEAHTHFGWTNSKTLDAIQKLPHEEHTLWAAQVAKQYLDTAGPPASARRRPSRASTA